MRFSKRQKIALTASLAVAAAVLFAAIICGSVFIAPETAVRTLFGGLFSGGDGGNAHVIIFSLRIPRALLAFLTGASTAAAGAAVQTCLRNPLASPFTLGASAGAALGAGAVIIAGVSLPVLGGFTLPAAAIVSSFISILLVAALARLVDEQLSGSTVVLCGMVLSLFMNAVLTTAAALGRENLQRISLWQLGSFALRGYEYVLLLLPFAAVGIAVLWGLSRRLDIMSFGDEQARALGVDTRRMRGVVLTTAAVLTGASVAVSGIIGFVDLVAPHLVRRIFGSKHARIIPLSALFGGTLMVLADLLARVVIRPAELPVGAVTALCGAPFFIAVFFARRRDGHA